MEFIYYKGFIDKVRGNMDFVLIILVFFTLITIGGINIFLYLNPRVSYFYFSMFCLVFFYFLFELNSINLKLRLADEGIYTERIYLRPSFISIIAVECEYGGVFVPFKQIKSFRIHGSSMMINNEGSDFYSDFNFRFNGLSEENLREIREKFAAKGIPEE